MLVKICGITTEAQAREISVFSDFIGYIFYPKSPRNTSIAFPSMHAKKTGVFVNATLSEVIHIAQLEKLQAVQLHGQESPDYCAALQSQLTVIKSFGIHEDFDFSVLEKYASYVDYFLFDTYTLLHGGSGRSFNWSLLQRYQLDIPFFLSGGLRPDSLEVLQQFKHPQWIGIDLNSGFETQPGIKNIEHIKSFIDAFNV